MALPELPDDRRAQPRRYVPADPSSSPHQEAGEEPPREQRQGSRQAPPQGRRPLSGARRQETAAGRLLGTQDTASERVEPEVTGRRRRADDGLPSDGAAGDGAGRNGAGRNGAGHDGAAANGAVDGAHDSDVPRRRLVDGPGRLSVDRSTLRGRPPMTDPARLGEPPRRPRRAAPDQEGPLDARHASVDGTAVAPRRDARRAPSELDSGAPTEPVRAREGDVAPGRRRAPEAPGRPVLPPHDGFTGDPTVATRSGRRRAEPDAPTPAAAAGAEPFAELDGEPGDAVRHRRRARGSAEERPASAYKELATDSRRARPGRRRRTSFWKELPLLIVVALLLTFLIQTFLAKVYVIPSGSMETTLHGCTGCNNDRVLVDKVTYRFSDPQPGDVVVFRGPDTWTSEVQVTPPSNVVVAALQQLGSLIGLAPPDEKDFVKRVIAVGGQTVQCCSPNGSVIVDNKPLTEPYIYYLPEMGAPKQATFGPITVPQGDFWAMGDSRNNSSDSRAHGAVPVDDIIGKARVIVLPFPRFGWIQAYNPQQGNAVGMGSPVEQGALALSLIGVLPLWRRRRRLDQVRGDRDAFDGFLGR